MPAFYHGVDPVLDHDHGSAPGIIEHSDKTPTLPPVIPEGAGGPHHGPKMKCTAAAHSPTPTAGALVSTVSE